MVVTIGDADHLAEIRVMAGGPTITEITPARLTSYFQDAQNWVELGAGVTVANLNTGEQGYSNIKSAISFRASSLIRYGWRDKENKAQEHAGEARRLILEIIKTMEQVTASISTSTFLTTTEYRTQNMNSNIDSYKSPSFNS